MMNLRKGYALLLVGMMVISGLVAFLSAPVVSADTPLRADWIDLDYNPTYMMGEAQYHIDFGDNSFFCLGEGDGIDDDAATTCQVRMSVNIIDDDVDDLMVNISQYSDTAFDFQDPDTSTDQIEGARSGPANPVAGNTNHFDFWFDVLATSTLGAPSSRDLTIRYWFWDENSGQERSDTLSNVKIYISSIWDNPANDPDGQLANALDANDDGPFEAGDLFEATTINLNNYDPAAAADDITCTVTEPGNGVTLAGGQNVCSIPGGIAAGNNDNLLYRTDVAVGTPPGVYTGSADVVYTRDDSDLTVTEANLVVDWEVDFSFADDDPFEDGNPYSEYQCVATDVTITDSDVGDDNVTRHDEEIEELPAQSVEVSDTSGETSFTTPVEEGSESQKNVVWVLAPVTIAVVSLIIISALLYSRKD